LSNAGLEQVGNEPFTEQEQSLVLQAIDRIETFLLDHAEVTEEQHAAEQLGTILGIARQLTTD